MTSRKHGPMQARVREKMREMGMPGFVSWFFTRRIPTLARWSRPPR